MTHVRILTQYWENYSDTKEPHWKAKGGLEFTLEMPADWFMYEKDRVVAIIKDMLTEDSNWHCKYEYLDFEPVFQKSIALNQSEFVKRFHAGGARREIKAPHDF